MPPRRPLRARRCRAPTAAAALLLAGAARRARALSAVYPEPPPEKGGEGTERRAELLRFVTAYRAGLEAVVDITPYSPLLQVAADADGGADFYAFIDTWVGNKSERPAVYLNNVTRKCTGITRSDGNGWTLDAELLLWPLGAGAEDTRPRDSLTLASGYFGANYPFGTISVQEGVVVDGGAAFLLDQAAELGVGTPAAGSGLLPVYRCPAGDKELGAAKLLGLAAREAKRLGNTSSTEADAFRLELLTALVSDDLVELNVSGTTVENRSVRCVLGPNSSTFSPERGMPVFYNPADVLVDTEYSSGRWLNMTPPFEAVGEIVEVDGGSVTLRMNDSCLPLNASVPRLLAPRNRTILPRAKALLDAALSLGQAGAGVPPPLLLQPLGGPPAARMGAPPLLGRLSGAPGPAGIGGANGSRGCLIREQRQGRLFERQFAAPAMKTGDRAVMQLAVTGHGWAATTEQCGEYCFAVYHVSLNHQRAVNVTQFWYDCHSNPINGDKQFGTWYESRNGWCPGSVEPGVYVDVTDSLRSGAANHLAFDVAVWSNASGAYEQYTDFAGFSLADRASLTVGLNLFVYDQSTVRAVLAQGRALTAAEAALRVGSSSTAATSPPAGEPAPLVYDPGRSLLELGRAGGTARDPLGILSGARPGGTAGPSAFASRGGAASFLRRERVPAAFADRRGAGWQERAQASAAGAPPRAARDGPGPSGGQQAGRLDTSFAAKVGSRGGLGLPGGRYDFEARAPWYLYNESVEGGLDKRGAVRVPVFSRELVQGDRREIRVKIRRGDLPAGGWAQAALRLRLSKPPDGLDFDHWDREASLGLVLRGSPDAQSGGGRAKLYIRDPAAAPGSARRKWAFEGGSR